MSNYSKYKIYPRRSNVEKIQNEVKIPKSNFLSVGCITYAISYTIIWYSLADFMHHSNDFVNIIGLIPLFLVPLFLAILAARITKSISSKSILSKQLNSEISVYEKEADTLTNELTELIKCSENVQLKLDNYLENASKLLKQCEKDYNENAFDPFWTGIENAAIELNGFKNDITSITINAKSFYHKLKGRVHNFPQFPIEINSLPNPTQIIDEFNRVVRLGQTNFQFALIWQQIKIRQTLIAGFSSLGEAVNNLGAIVINGFNSMQQSLQFEIAPLIEEFINSQQATEKELIEQNKMLDNIQRGHKPWF